MTEPATPPEFRRPERLTQVPEYLIKQAVTNITALVDHDTEKCDEVVRRVLAALLLAAPDMPDALTYRYPDGYATDEPMHTAAVHVCKWGMLRRNGDVVMCALDEPYEDGDPGPGHDTPGEHGWRDADADDDHTPFRESDPRAFHAPTWEGAVRPPVEISTHHL